MVFSLCVSVFTFLVFIGIPVILDYGPTLLQYNLILNNYICDDLISKWGHIWWQWDVGLQHTNFGGGHNLTHNAQ